MPKKPPKKELRVQCEPLSKKAKSKPPFSILWDGEQDPLQLVQKRFKAAASLRDPDSKVEFTREALKAHDEKKIILASSTPSRLENGHYGDDEDAREKPSAAEEELATVLSSPDGTTRMVVVDGKPVVLDSFPYPPDLALSFKQSGLLFEMRSQLHIKISYNDDLKAFEFSGDEKAIQRAKSRFSKLLADGISVIKVPSSKDTCGKVIGTGGSTVNKIKKACGIDHNLSVAWDKESEQLVLTTPFFLDDLTKGLLYRIVDDIVNNRDWQTAQSIRNCKLSEKKVEVLATDEPKQRKIGSRAARKKAAMKQNSKGYH